MTDKERSEIQESLLLLYLRLNGYFVTGFIAHSKDKGKNLAEIDALAVRHPFNREPKREIGPSRFLHPKGADLLVCEVKSRGEPLQFNESFRENDEVIQDVLAWSGLFDEEETAEIARNLKPLLQPGVAASAAEIGVPGPRAITIRPLLCKPELRSRNHTQPWFLNEGEMFRFISDCLNPVVPRADCASVYSLNCWGSVLMPFVEYFKKELPPGIYGGIKGLYKYIETHRQRTVNSHSEKR